jgi:hypothetical protein
MVTTAVLNDKGNYGFNEASGGIGMQFSDSTLGDSV